MPKAWHTTPLLLYYFLINYYTLSFQTHTHFLRRSYYKFPSKTSQRLHNFTSSQQKFSPPKYFYKIIFFEDQFFYNLIVYVFLTAFTSLLDIFFYNGLLFVSPVGSRVTMSEANWRARRARNEARRRRKIFWTPLTTFPEASQLFILTTKVFFIKKYFIKKNFKVFIIFTVFRVFRVFLSNLHQDPVKVSHQGLSQSSIKASHKSSIKPPSRSHCSFILRRPTGAGQRPRLSGGYNTEEEGSLI